MTETVPRVSVVIPAYNRAGAVRASVESVLRQTLPDLEVVAVDDASDDGTAEALEAIAAEDPRLRVVRHEVNQGGSVARNTGIAHARADWVAFQDSDDEWLPAKLARQFAAVERLGPETIGAYCGMLILGSAEAEAGAAPSVAYHPPPLAALPMEGNLALSLLLGGSLISTQTLLARREALLDAGGFDPALRALQDWDCVLRLAKLGPIAFDPEPLVIQRFSSNSLTRSRRGRVDALERILEKHEAELSRHPRAFAGHLHRLAGGRRLLGEPAAARRALMRALRLDPVRGRSWLALGAALAQARTGRR